MSVRDILALSTPTFLQQVEDARMVHGEQHIMMARALNELGEHYFKKGEIAKSHDKDNVEDLVRAREILQKSLKIQADLAGGKFSKGAYTWKHGIPPEEFVDTHYKLGLVLAAESQGGWYILKRLFLYVVGV